MAWGNPYKENGNWPSFHGYYFQVQITPSGVGLKF